MGNDSQKSSSPKVKVQLGRLPECWPFSAIFLANLDCIFFGDPLKTEEIARNVMGFHGYGARMLPILGLLFRGGRNLLVLQEEPNQDLAAFFRDRLGLSLPELAYARMPDGCGLGRLDIEEPALERMRGADREVLDGYVTDTHLERLAAEINKRNLNTQESCRLANDKIALNRFLSERGLPVFDGGESGSDKELRRILSDLTALGYRKAAVRAAIGASGFGMQLISLKEAPEPLSDVLKAEDRLLVQGWVEEGRLGCSGVASPSVQFFCGQDNRVALYDFTDQLLSNDSIHEGNLSPPISIAGEEPLKSMILGQAMEVAAWVAGLGYLGPGSVDFLIWRKQGSPQVLVCEVNARVTGATYPSLLALYCNPGGAWLMRNMVFGPCMTVREFLHFLEGKKLLFSLQRRRGIIPVNVISAANGQIFKCQLLFLASSSPECLAMMEEFPGLLPSYCRFERD